MSPLEAGTVLVQAERLQSESKTGSLAAWLAGRNIAVLCSRAGNDTEFFRGAAAELGAHVAQVRMDMWNLQQPVDVGRVSSVLGRLYDCVDCHDVSPTLLAQIRQGAGIPVCDGIGSPSHHLVRLSERLSGDASPINKRRFVVQAALIVAITSHNP